MSLPKRDKGKIKITIHYNEFKITFGIDRFLPHNGINVVITLILLVLFFDTFLILMKIML